MSGAGLHPPFRRHHPRHQVYGGEPSQQVRSAAAHATCSAACFNKGAAAVRSASSGVQLHAEHHLPRFARFAERPDHWRNFVAAYDLNRVFFIGGDSLVWQVRRRQRERQSENVLRESLHEHILKYRNAKNLDKDNNLYWISWRAAAGRRLSVCADADLYRQQAGGAAGQRTDRSAGGISLPPATCRSASRCWMRTTSRCCTADGDRYAASLNSYPAEHAYFGYVDNYRDLILKKVLPPSSLSVYALPVKA